MNLASRRKLRLRLRDLAAASAYAAVALSGAMPVWVSVLFALSFIVALLGFRPLAGLRTGAVLVLLALAVILFGLAFRGALNLVVAAVAFASLVTAHRMLAAPEPATDRQVLLASLLLIAGAAALSGEIWYAACLLAFGVFACLTLGLGVVEGPVERDEDLPLRPVLRQVSVGVALALAGGVAFFILFPRISWNVAARRATPPLLGGTTGMTDRVRLGGGGSIKTSARVVARATLDPDPGVDHLERYWVGRHFDTFDGQEWRGSGVPGAPKVYAGLSPLIPGTQVQRIELLPAYESRTLIGLAQPLAFSQAQALSTAGSTTALMVIVKGEEVHFATPGNAYRYVAFTFGGDIPAGRLDEDERARALALPEHLDPRVAQLAERVAGTDGDPRSVARKLEGWLKNNLGYTLELAGEGDAPLSHFLFDRRAGHCEHFATALAVLLRTRGIPSRVVGGFFGGERVGERYVVRAGDAHAWVEAWIDGRGWITLDATPEAGRSNQPIAALARLIDLYESLEEYWRKRVVDYSLIDQVGFVRDLVQPPRGQRTDDAHPEATGGTVPFRQVLGALAAVVLTWLVWRGLSRRLAQRPHPATSFLTEVERRLSRAHIARQDGEGLEELSRRLSSRRHPAAATLQRVTRRYLEARFGARPLPSAERRALLHSLERELSPRNSRAQEPGPS